MRLRWGERMIDIKAENKKASDWLLEYPQRLHTYIEAIENMKEFSALSATEYTGMPGGGKIGHPPESKSMTLIDYSLQAPELELQRQWIMVIEEVEKVFGEKKLVFLELRRRAENIEFKTVGRPAWTGYVQEKYADWFYRKYRRASVPGTQTMKDWWKDMVDVTVRVAIRHKCL